MAAKDLSGRIATAVRKTVDSASLIDGLLRDALDWNIPDGLTIDDLSYGWTVDELRSAGLDADLVDGRVLQIADLHPDQPWGLFVVEFRRPDAVRGDRGLTGTLRKVLRGLVESRAKSSALPSWKREHLLFICTHDYNDFRFAYFKHPPEGVRTAPLATFGWGVGRPAKAAVKLNLPHLVWPADPTDAPGWVEAWTHAFDVERVTKKFYDEYKALHDCFVARARNVARQSDRPLLASVVLNRLMFVYFLQRRGFLDHGDAKYLERRFDQSVKTHPGRFYQRFLSTLFFDGLAKRDRPDHVTALIGDVRYLNGGLFVRNGTEADADAAGHPIDWPDDAFAAALDLFGRYSWNLDDAASGDDNEINPDVLGYIFEQYINDRADMGAYYTKEDITGYISRSTIVPFLLDAAAAACPAAFAPAGPVWATLAADPSRYIFPSVRRGVLDADGRPIPLPADVAAGIADVARRDGWNRPAPAPFGLPTETWREHVARRDRCLALHARLAAGGVTRVDDLVTLNLDLTRFALDVVAAADAPLLDAIATATERISVLDPTCGSGAFLFAALNLLATLYDTCLTRMQALLDAGHAAGKTADRFRTTLARVATHPSRGYFVAKSVIVNNLYGVDLMAEAVEICKLRLFLRLVGQVDRADQIEPLPDIDFNVQAGNTLVGFATLQEVYRAISFVKFDFEGAGPRIAKQADAAHQKLLAFLDAQRVDAPSETLPAKKAAYRQAIIPLRQELDGYLATQNGVVGPNALERFRIGCNPFHWCADFFGSLNEGGFDVVIGNPPYVATTGVDYLSPSDSAMKLPDIYGHVLLRSLSISHEHSRFGLIVPLSITFSREFAAVRRAMANAGASWFSSFDNIPAALFQGLSQRCTIWIGGGKPAEPAVSPMYRWRSVRRPSLVDNIAFTRTTNRNTQASDLPKLASSRQAMLLGRIDSAARIAQRPFVVKRSEYLLRFSPSARNFVSAYNSPPPCLDANTLDMLVPSDMGEIAVTDESDIFASVAAVTGELYFSYWLTRGDGFHVTGWIMADFINAIGGIPAEDLDLLARIGRIHHARRYEALVFKKNAGKYVGNFNYRGHGWLTRRADLVLLAGLGVDRETAIDVFDFVQRTLAINVSAGEKSIPAEVKARYAPSPEPPADEAATLAEADRRVADHFGFSPAELAALTSGATADTATDLDN